MASAAITGWLFPVLSLAYSLPSQQLSSERLVLPTVQLPHTWALIFSSVLSTAYSVILLLLELFKEQGSLVLSVLYHLVFFRTINFQDYLVLCFSKLCKSLPRWSSHYISSWPSLVLLLQDLLLWTTSSSSCTSADAIRACLFYSSRS